MLQWATRFFEKKSSLAAPDDWLRELFGAIPSVTGVSVNPRSALTCTAVACAVRTIAEPCGSLPLHVYKRGADGARDRDPQHPAYRVLHANANPWTGAGDFRTQLTTDALLHGNGFAFVNRVDGRVRELVRLQPGAVTAKVDDTTGEPIYELRGNTGTRRLDRRDVLHIRCSLSHDGLNGESPVHLAREAIGLALVMEQHASQLFGNGARPAGTIENDKVKLGPNAVENIRKVLTAQNEGARNSGRTMILPEGWKFNPLTFNSTDAQFLELRKYAVDEIARAFRVPPHLLFEMGRATWGNSEELGAAFLTYSLMFWLKSWEGAINRVLFTEEERETHFAEFLVDDLLRADFTKRSDGISKMISARVLNPNEARKIAFNLSPYDGGDEFVNPNTTAAPAGAGAE
jgi:HK97 family phage portal protein